MEKTVTVRQRVALVAASRRGVDAIRTALVSMLVPAFPGEPATAGEPPIRCWCRSPGRYRRANRGDCRAVSRDRSVRSEAHGRIGLPCEPDGRSEAERWRRWHDHVRCPDVVRRGGSVAATRFSRAELRGFVGGHAAGWPRSVSRTGRIGALRVSIDQWRPNLGGHVNQVWTRVRPRFDGRRPT